MSEYSTIEPAVPGYWLWRLWQVVIVPLFYPLFGLGCILLLLFVPLAHLLLREPLNRTRWFRLAVHHCARVWFNLARLLRVFDYRWTDGQAEHLLPLQPAAPESGNNTLGHLVLANHPALIDVLMILAVMPDLCCVMKSDLSQHPILGLLIRNLNYLSNDNPELWLVEAQVRLENGESLLVFPEGTRTEPGQQVTFKLGAVELARRTQATVLPLVVHYNSHYLSKSCPWYELPHTKLTYQLELGPAISTRTVAVNSNPRQSRRWLNQELQRYFRERLARPLVWPSDTVGVASIRRDLASNVQNPNL
jgi:1-acyl-sn-glycerol-3-phosphate acyltransferase